MEQSPWAPPIAEGRIPTADEVASEHAPHEQLADANTQVVEATVPFMEDAGDTQPQYADQSREHDVTHEPATSAERAHMFTDRAGDLLGSAQAQSLEWLAQGLDDLQADVSQDTADDDREALARQYDRVVESGRRNLNYELRHQRQGRVEIPEDVIDQRKEDMLAAIHNEDGSLLEPSEALYVTSHVSSEARSAAFDAENNARDERERRIEAHLSTAGEQADNDSHKERAVEDALASDELQTTDVTAEQVGELKQTFSDRLAEIEKLLDQRPQELGAVALRARRSKKRAEYHGAVQSLTNQIHAEVSSLQHTIVNARQELEQQQFSRRRAIDGFGFDGALDELKAQIEAELDQIDAQASSQAEQDWITATQPQDMADMINARRLRKGGLDSIEFVDNLLAEVVAARTGTEAPTPYWKKLAVVSSSGSVEAREFIRSRAGDKAKSIKAAAARAVEDGEISEDVFKAINLQLARPQGASKNLSSI